MDTDTDFTKYEDAEKRLAQLVIDLRDNAERMESYLANLQRIWYAPRALGSVQAEAETLRVQRDDAIAETFERDQRIAAWEKKATALLDSLDIARDERRAILIEMAGLRRQIGDEIAAKRLEREARANAALDAGEEGWDPAHEDGVEFGLRIAERIARGDTDGPN